MSRRAIIQTLKCPERGKALNEEVIETWKGPDGEVEDVDVGVEDLKDQKNVLSSIKPVRKMRKLI